MNQLQCLEKPNFIITFDVSNAKQQYDCFFWVERDRTDLERNPSQENAD